MKGNMKKRFLSLLLVLCMSMSVCSAAVAGSDKKQEPKTQETVEKQKKNNGKKVGHNKKEAAETPEAPMAPAAPVVPEEEPTEPEVPAEPTVTIDNTSIVEGTPITVTTEGYPEGSVLTYKWERISCEYTTKADNKYEVDIDETAEEVGTGASYTPIAADREKWLQVTVTCEEYEPKTAKVYFSKLPVVYLDFPVDYVIATKTEYVKSDIDMQGNGKFTEGLVNEGEVSVKGRGNSSWASDKKPFKLKFSDKQNMLGMGKNKHWVLLADATEGSHMRNELSYKLSGQFGLTYQDGTWVDLVINDEYYGMYYLCEHVRVGGTRVDVADHADDAEAAAEAVCAEDTGCIPNVEAGDLAGEMEEDLSWIDTDSFTYTYTDVDGTEKTTTFKVSDYWKDYNSDLLSSGGVLLELDSYYDEISKFKSSLNQPIMYKTPEFAYTSEKQISYTKNFINSFEAAIQNPNFYGSYNGKSVSAYDLFDFDALVKYWMVEELFMNADGMKKSTYLHKDRDTAEEIKKMNMGPVWDMDWSSDGEAGGHYDSWQTKYYSDSAQGKQWYKYITKDPYFLTRAQEYYWEHRAEMKDMIASVRGNVDTELFCDNAYDYLYESAKENEKRWSKVYSGREFEDEVKILENFLNKRMNWLDAQMESVETMGFYTADESVQLTYSDGDLKIVAPGAKADVLVNGKLVDTITLTGNRGKVAIDAESLTDKRDVIYVVVYDVAGRKVGTNYCYDQELEKGNLLEYKLLEKPERLVYSVGDNLNLKGMHVVSLYENGYSEKIPNMDLTVTGFDSTTAGKKTITVTYGTWSDTFDVVVGNEITEWANDYVTIGADKTLGTGDKTLKVEVWESGAGMLYSSDNIQYDGNFSDINFSVIAKDGWTVPLVKYRDGAFESGAFSVGGKNGTFKFDGVETANTLIIDLVKETPKTPVETKLADSFTATDCGTLTTEASGTANRVGFMVYKGEERVFTSTKPFTYDGNFTNLKFNYTAPAGFEVDTITAANAMNGRISGTYTDGMISFTNDNGAEYIIIKLKEKAAEPFTLTCNKTTVRIRTNAIVYLKSNDTITEEDIKVFENGNEITTFKTPVWDATTGAWKVYLMPATLGKHVYTITVNGFSQNITINGSKTGL